MADPTISGGTNTSALVATFEDMHTFSNELARIQHYAWNASSSTAAMARNADLLASVVLSPMTATDAEEAIFRAAGVFLAQSARLTVLHLFVDGAIASYQAADSALASAAKGMVYVGGFVVGAVAVPVALVAASGAVVVGEAYAEGVEVAYQFREIGRSAGKAWDAAQSQLQKNPWLITTLVFPGGVSPLITTGVDAFASAYSPTDAARAANQKLTADFKNLVAEIPSLAQVKTWAGQNTDLVRILVDFLPGILAGATFDLGPGINGGLTVFTGQPWPPLDYDQTVNSIIGGGARFGAFNDATGKPTVTPINIAALTGSKAPPTTPTDVKSLFRGSYEIDTNGAHKFADIRITDRVDSDGQHHWIVQIPSTQNWSPQTSAVPNDLSSDVSVEGGHPTVLMAAVKDAMSQAGIGSNDPVMLTGFSLGGITAGALAADPWMNNHYTITNLVTAGSGIANFAVPSTVNVLSFEHNNDLVPTMCGVSNPATTNWVTYHSDPLSAGDPHDARRYGNTGAVFQSSGDPNARVFNRSAEGFFSGGTVTVQDYKAVR